MKEFFIRFSQTNAFKLLLIVLDIIGVICIFALLIYFMVPHPDNTVQLEQSLKAVTALSQIR